MWKRRGGDRSQIEVGETRKVKEGEKVGKCSKVKGGSAERFRKLPRAELQ